MTLSFLANLFPLWVTLFSALALFHPPALTWFGGPLIPLGLSVIMLGMGLTLSVDDFRRVLRRPRSVAIGFVLQYTIMPLSGFCMSRVLRLPPELAVGLVLVACCPGGTASNVICYLARLDVPLSVTMTATSTLLAPVMTPLLTAWFAGAWVDVDAAGLFFSTVEVVLVPVLLGVLINRMMPGWTARLQPVFPLLAVLVICLIVGSVLGAGRDKVLSAGWRLLAGVAGLHGLGFGLGYVCARLFKCDVTASRTISIEVGMQNSGLGVVLARQNFPNPATALPSAISSLTHCLFASALAALWRRRPSRP